MMYRTIAIGIVSFFFFCANAQETPKVATKDDLDMKKGGGVVSKITIEKSDKDFSTNSTGASPKPVSVGDNNSGVETDNLDRIGSPKTK